MLRPFIVFLWQGDASSIFAFFVHAWLRPISIGVSGLIEIPWVVCILWLHVHKSRQISFLSLFEYATYHWVAISAVLNDYWAEIVLFCISLEHPRSLDLTIPREGSLSPSQVDLVVVHAGLVLRRPERLVQHTLIIICLVLLVDQWLGLSIGWVGPELVVCCVVVFGTLIVHLVVIDEWCLSTVMLIWRHQIVVFNLNGGWLIALIVDSFSVWTDDLCIKTRAGLIRDWLFPTTTRFVFIQNLLLCLFDDHIAATLAWFPTITLKVTDTALRVIAWFFCGRHIVDAGLVARVAYLVQIVLFFERWSRIKMLMVYIIITGSRILLHFIYYKSIQYAQSNIAS